MSIPIYSVNCILLRQMDFPQQLWSYSPSFDYFQPPYIPYESTCYGNSYLSDGFDALFPAFNDTVAQGLPRKWEYNLSSSKVQSVQDSNNGQNDQHNSNNTESFQSSLTTWGQSAIDYQDYLSCFAPGFSTRNDQVRPGFFIFTYSYSISNLKFEQTSYYHDPQSILTIQDTIAPVKPPSPSLHVSQKYFWGDLLEEKDELTLPEAIQKYLLKPEECNRYTIKGFSRKYDLKRHIRNPHQDNSAACPNCEAVVARLDS